MSELLKRLFSSEGKERFEVIIDRLILLNTLLLLIAIVYAAISSARISVRHSGAIIEPLISLAALVYVRERGEDGIKTAIARVLFFGLRDLFLLIFYPRPF